MPDKMSQNYKKAIRDTNRRHSFGNFARASTVKISPSPTSSMSLYRKLQLRHHDMQGSVEINSSPSALSRSVDTTHLSSPLRTSGFHNSVQNLKPKLKVLPRVQNVHPLLNEIYRSRETDRQLLSTPESVNRRHSSLFSHPLHPTPRPNLSIIPGYAPIVNLNNNKQFRNKRKKSPILKPTVKIASPSIRKFCSPESPVQHSTQISATSIIHHKPIGSHDTAAVVNALRVKSRKRCGSNENRSLENENYQGIKRRKQDEPIPSGMPTHMFKEPEFMPDLSVNGYSLLPLHLIGMKRPVTPSIDMDHLSSEAPSHRHKANGVSSTKRNPISSSLSSSRYMTDAREQSATKKAKINGDPASFLPIHQHRTSGESPRPISPSARRSLDIAQTSPDYHLTEGSTPGISPTTANQNYTSASPLSFVTTAASRSSPESWDCLPGLRRHQPIRSSIVYSPKLAQVKQIVTPYNDILLDRKKDWQRGLDLLSKGDLLRSSDLNTNPKGQTATVNTTLTSTSLGFPLSQQTSAALSENLQSWSSASGTAALSNLPTSSIFGNNTPFSIQASQNAPISPVAVANLLSTSEGTRTITSLVTPEVVSSSSLASANLLQTTLANKNQSPTTTSPLSVSQAPVIPLTSTSLNINFSFVGNQLGNPVFLQSTASSSIASTVTTPNQESQSAPVLPSVTTVGLIQSPTTIFSFSSTSTSQMSVGSTLPTISTPASAGMLMFGGGASTISSQPGSLSFTTTTPRSAELESSKSSLFPPITVGSSAGLTNGNFSFGSSSFLQPLNTSVSGSPFLNSKTNLPNFGVGSLSATASSSLFPITSSIGSPFAMKTTLPSIVSTPSLMPTSAFSFSTGTVPSTASAPQSIFGKPNTSLGSSTSISFGAPTTSIPTNVGPTSATGFNFSNSTTKPFVFGSQTANISSSTATSQSGFSFGMPQTTSAPFMFGVPSSTTSVFSASVFTSTTSPSSGFTFGTSTTQSAMFGGAISSVGQSTSNPPSIFGISSNQKSSTTVTPTFGAPLNPAPSFGSTNATTVFGSVPNQAPAFNFSSNQTQAFGSGKAELPTFGSGTNQTASFGAPNTGFGSTNQAPTFGSVPHQKTTFGSSANPPSIFGCVSNQPSVFGSSSFGNSNTPAFGSGTNPQPFATPTFGHSPFAKSSPASTTGFQFNQTPTFNFGASSNQTFSQSTPVGESGIRSRTVTRGRRRGARR